jgi:integrase
MEMIFCGKYKSKKYFQCQKESCKGRVEKDKKGTRITDEHTCGVLNYSFYCNDHIQTHKYENLFEEKQFETINNQKEIKPKKNEEKNQVENVERENSLNILKDLDSKDSISLEALSTKNTSNLVSFSQSKVEIVDSYNKSSTIQDILIFNEHEQVAKIKEKYDFREKYIKIELDILKMEKEKERNKRLEVEFEKNQILEAEIREKKLREESEAREIRLREEVESHKKEAETREKKLREEAETREKKLRDEAERKLKEETEAQIKENLRLKEESEAQKRYIQELVKTHERKLQEVLAAREQQSKEEAEARERQFREEVEIRERKLKEETKAQIKNLRFKEKSEAQERRFREESEVRERQIQEKAEAHVKEASCVKDNAETRERWLQDKTETREKPLQEEAEIRLNEAFELKNIYEKEQTSIFKDKNEMEIDDNTNLLINNKFDSSSLENYKNVFEFYPRYFTTIFNKKLGSMKKYTKNKKQCSSCFTYLNLDYSKCEHCNDFFHIYCCFIEKSTICNNCYKEFEFDIVYEPINLNIWKSTCKNCKEFSTEGFCKECRQIILKQIESFGLIPLKENVIELELKACVMTEKTTKIFHESIENIFNKKKIQYLNENIYINCVKSNNDATEDPKLKKLSPKDVLTIMESKGCPIKLIEDDEQGVVVCATEEIEKNSYLCEYQGEVVPQRSIMFFPANDSFMDLLKTGISAKNLTIDPTNQCNWAKFISRHPNEKKNNTSVVTVNINGEAKVILYAIKNIQKNEIIYYNYQKPKKIDSNNYKFKQFYSKIETNENYHKLNQSKFENNFKINEKIFQLESNDKKINSYFLTNNIAIKNKNKKIINFNNKISLTFEKKSKIKYKNFLSKLKFKENNNMLKKKRNRKKVKEKTILSQMALKIKNIDKNDLLKSFEIKNKNSVNENCWIEYLNTLSTKTCSMYIKYIYLFEKWCNENSTQISYENIMNFLIETKSTKYELKNVLCALKSKYEKFYRIEIMKIPKIAKAKDKIILSDIMYQKILEIFDLKNDGTKEYIEFLYYSACRKNESIKIKWSDIKKDEKNYSVYVKASKLGNHRKVAIKFKLIEKIRSFFDNSNEFVFPKKMTNCANKIKEFHLHQLRHKRATDLYNKGLSVSDISYILGHKNESTTRKYLNLDCDLKFESMKNNVLLNEKSESEGEN